MRETFLVSLSLILLVGASFCIYQVLREKRVLTGKKVGHHSQTKSGSHCENELKIKEVLFEGWRMFLSGSQR